MRRKTKILILTSALLLTVILTYVGYFFYNKGPLDILNSRAISVNATELYQAYSTDTITASNKYSNNILVVIGQVTEISENHQSQKIILLRSNLSNAHINCTMEGASENINISDTISIKGLCTGIGDGDPDLGIAADVYLTRCHLDN